RLFASVGSWRPTSTNALYRRLIHDPSRNPGFDCRRTADARDDMRSRSIAWTRSVDQPGSARAVRLAYSSWKPMFRRLACRLARHLLRINGTNQPRSLCQRGRWAMFSSNIGRAVLAAAAAFSLWAATDHAAQAGGTLRVAMTASDVPTTTGAPDNGFEG